MTRPTRHRINAAICGLVLIYAVYQFASGEASAGGSLRVWLVGAEAVLGVIGVIWFWRRSLGAA